MNCGAEDVQSGLQKLHPELQKLEEVDEAAYRAGARRPQKSAPPPYTLPVVFHVVHDGGGENLSEARITAGLRHANEAFANQGYYDPSTGVDTRIQFCLAARTPTNGPTNGITRRTDALTNVEYNREDRDLKALVQWDPLSYINIYVVREICRSPGNGCNVAGYAYYPSAHGLGIDGIVVEARWLGSNEANAGVLVHELGHYLGLRHTFAGGCANDDCLRDGDAVCDTPPDNSTAAVPCTGSVNTCSTDTDSGFATDQDDMIENYMDYGYFKCYSAFTPGQRDRMHFFIEGRRRSLLESFGCQPPCPAPVTAAFAGGDVTVDVGTTINFTNQSSNGSRYSWRVAGTEEGTADNFTRAFTGEGTYTVQLLAASTDPLCGPDSAQATVRVVCSVTSAFELPTSITGGQSVTFVNTSTGATAYTWSVAGAPAPAAGGDLSYTFPSGGVYEVCLTATDGNCSRDLCRSVFVRRDDPGGGGGGGGGGNPGDCDNPFTAFYGDDQPDTPREFSTLARGDDGSFFIGGSVRNNPMLMRTDATGEPIWTTELYPDAALGYVTGLLLDREGFLVGIGATETPGSNPVDKNGWAARVDPADGTVVWSREYTSPAFERTFKEVLQPSVGGPYVVVGEATLATSGLAQGMVFGIDPATGDLFDESLQSNADRLTFGGAVLSPSTGNIYAAGVATSANDRGLRLTELDANGVILNDRIAHSDLRVTFGEQRIALDGADRVVATDFTGRSGSGLRVYRFGPTGSLTFAVELTDARQALNLRGLRTTPGGYLVHALVENLQDQLILLDRAGNVVWSRRYDTGIGEAYTFGQALLLEGSRPVLATNDAAADHVTILSRLSARGTPTDDCYYSEPAALTVVALEVVDGALLYEQLPSGAETNFLGWEPSRTLLSDRSCRPACEEEEICDNGEDDDRDGLTDCDDPDVSSTCCCRSAPSIDLGPDVRACAGVVLRPDTSAGDWRLSWSTGETTDSIVVREPGRYILTVTDSCGGTASDTVTVELRSIPPLDLGPDVVVCQNGTVTLRAPRGFAEYFWSDGSMDTSFTTDGTGDFWLTATDSCGRVASDTINVTEALNTIIDLGPDTTICLGDSLRFAVPGFSDYQWSQSTYLDCFDCAAVTFRPTADTLLLLAAVYGPGCISDDSIRVRVTTDRGLRDSVSICAGDSLMLPSGTVRNAGTYTFAVRDLGCIRVDTLVVSVLPEIAPGRDTIRLCRGETTTINNTPVTEPGDYPTVLIAENGCDSLRITTLARLEQDTIVRDTLSICPGDTLRLDGLIVTGPGVFARVSPWVAGCDSITETTVILTPSPLLKLPGRVTIALGDSVELRPTTDLPDTTIYDWFDGAGNLLGRGRGITVQPTVTTAYTLTYPGGGAYACPLTAFTEVVVANNQSVYLPTAFSPNGDEVNERFWPGLPEAVAMVEEFRVYDRWGGLAYELSEPTLTEAAGWDGTVEGRPASPGVYAYTLKLRFRDGRQGRFAGELLLVR